VIESHRVRQKREIKWVEISGADELKREEIKLMIEPDR